MSHCSRPYSSPAPGLWAAAADPTALHQQGYEPLQQTLQISSTRAMSRCSRPYNSPAPGLWAAAADPTALQHQGYEPLKQTNCSVLIPVFVLSRFCHIWGPSMVVWRQECPYTSTEQSTRMLIGELMAMDGTAGHWPETLYRGGRMNEALWIKCSQWFPNFNQSFPSVMGSKIILLAKIRWWLTAHYSSTYIFQFMKSHSPCASFI